MRDYRIRLAHGEYATITLSRLEGNSWEVDWLSVSPQHRGKGWAHLLLASVARDADREGATLVLQAVACAEGDKGLQDAQRKLLSLYRAHGFKETGHLGGLGGPILAREPQKGLTS